jgi:hypothetical protein
MNAKYLQYINKNLLTIPVLDARISDHSPVRHDSIGAVSSKKTTKMLIHNVQNTER